MALLLLLLVFLLAMLLLLLPVAGVVNFDLENLHMGRLDENDRASAEPNDMHVPLLETPLVEPKHRANLGRMGFGIESFEALSLAWNVLE